MNFFLKQKLWFFIAMFFMVVNIVLICLLFHHKRHSNFGRHQREFSREHFNSFQRGNFRNGNMRSDRNKNRVRRMEFISEALDFSDEQKENLKNIYEDIETKKDGLFEKHEELKKMFNQALYSENTNQQYLDSLIKVISLNSESYNRLRIEKANKIKALCTDEQKEKLSTVYSQKNAAFNDRNSDNHRRPERHTK